VKPAYFTPRRVPYAQVNPHTGHLQDKIPTGDHRTNRTYHYTRGLDTRDDTIPTTRITLTPTIN